MCCKIEKSDILPLLTLAYDKFTISGIFDILQKVMQLLSLTNNIVYNKIIMLKGDLLIVRNATWVIFYWQDKPTSLYQFDWIESIAGLFYLQMNLLRFMLEKL